MNPNPGFRHLATMFLFPPSISSVSSLHRGRWMTHFGGEILLLYCSGWLAGTDFLPSRKRNGAKIELFRVRGRDTQLLPLQSRNLGVHLSDTLRLGSIEARGDEPKVHFV